MWKVNELTILFLSLLWTGSGAIDLFQCQSSSTQTQQHYIPNIPDKFFDSASVAEHRRVNNVTSTARLIVFVFTIHSDMMGDSNCSGYVKEIQTCYQARHYELNRKVNYLSLLILSRNVSTFTIERNIPLKANPKDSICTLYDDSTKYVCCETISLSDESKFQTDALNFTFGVFVLGPIRPLRFLHQYRQTYYVDQFQQKIEDLPPAIFVDSELTSSSLLFLRFIYEDIIPTTINQPGSGISFTHHIGSNISTYPGAITSYKSQISSIQSISNNVSPTASITNTREVVQATEVSKSMVLLSSSLDQASDVLVHSNIQPSHLTVEKSFHIGTTAIANTGGVGTLEVSTVIMSSSNPSSDVLTQSNIFRSVPTAEVSFDIGTTNTTEVVQTTEVSESMVPFLSFFDKASDVLMHSNIFPSLSTEERSFNGATTKYANIKSEVTKSLKLLPTPDISSYFTKTSESSNPKLPLQTELKPYATAQSELKTTMPPSLHFSSTTKFLVSPSSSTKIVGGVVGGALSIPFILPVLLCLLLVISKSRKRRRKSPTRDGISFDNGIFNDGGDAEYADVGPVPSNIYNTNQQKYRQKSYAQAGASYESIYEEPEDSRAIEMLKKFNMQAQLDDNYGFSRDEDNYVIPAYDKEELYVQLDTIKVSKLMRNAVKLGVTLGSGHFGEVYKGILQSGEGDIEVAVKTLKEGCNEDDRVKFLQEAAIMGQFRHPNVVTMYGMVMSGEPVLLVQELLAKGDLRNYLLTASQQKNNESIVDCHTLLSFCRQVASGMVYLSGKGFVHRDLAARNILVSDDEVCKIADFGMSRDLMYDSFYVSHGGVIPVKWTAPEAIHYKKFSTASDVWGFAALMYEIWSMGHKPFESVSNKKVLTKIDSGFRLAPPPGCPRQVYALMMDCWHSECSKRPTFLDVSRTLSLPDTKLLQWSEEDKSVHPQSSQLGASLQAASDLFKDLQTIYQDLPE